MTCVYIVSTANHVVTRQLAAWAAGLWIGVLLIISGGCQPAATPAKTPSQVERPVPTAPAHLASAELRVWPQLVRVQGSLIGDEHAVIGAKVAGLVQVVNVDLGAKVHSGDILAELHPADFDLKVQQAQAQLQQARAQLGLKPGDPEEKLNRQMAPPVLQEQAVLEEARYNLQRAQALIQQNTITASELQQREATLRVAEARYLSALNSVDQQIAALGVFRAQLALAEQARSDAVIRAPFDGIVEQRHVAPGVYLQPGQPVLTLVRTDPLRFRSGVPEREAVRVALGQRVNILIEGEPKPLTAQITRISPALDMTSRALIIEVDVPNPGLRLRAGLFAEAEIIVDQAAQVLTVPSDAVSDFAGVERVLVFSDGQVRERQVHTGRRLGRYVEIVDGLSPGEQVADNGPVDPLAPIAARREDSPPTDSHGSRGEGTAD